MLLAILLPLAFISGVTTNPTPQDGALDQCGLPVNKTVACANDEITGCNLPIKDLSCGFNLKTSNAGARNKIFSIQYYFPPADPVAGFISAGLQLLGLSNGTITANIGRGGPPYILTLYTNPSSETSTSIGFAKDREEPPRDFTLKYKCLSGQPTLIVAPEPGTYFALDTNQDDGTDEGSRNPHGTWFSVLNGSNDGIHAFKEIDVLVKLNYV